MIFYVILRLKYSKRYRQTNAPNLDNFLNSSWRLGYAILLSFDGIRNYHKRLCYACQLSIWIGSKCLFLGLCYQINRMLPSYRERIFKPPFHGLSECFLPMISWNYRFCMSFWGGLPCEPENLLIVVDFADIIEPCLVLLNISFLH